MTRSPFESFLIGRRLPPRTAPPEKPTPLRDVVSARDFSAPPPEVETGPSAEEIAAQQAAEAARQAAEAVRQAELAAARAAGHAQGRDEALAEAEGTQQAAIALALGSIAAALEDATERTHAVAEDAARELGLLLLSALDACLPAASARLAPDTAQQIAELCLPILDHAPQLVLHVAAGLGEDCAARIADRRVLVEEDPALAPGDVRASWHNGYAVRELATQRQAVAAVLATFNLQEG